MFWSGIKEISTSGPTPQRNSRQSPAVAKLKARNGFLGCVGSAFDRDERELFDCGFKPSSCQPRLRPDPYSGTEIFDLGMLQLDSCNRNCLFKAGADLVTIDGREAGFVRLSPIDDFSPNFSATRTFLAGL